MMKTPFTSDQFFQVFEMYNHGVFPLQLLLLLAGLLAILFMHGERRYRDEFITGVLAFSWLWTGIVYHLLYFTTINQAAYGFGVLFLLQGAFFLHSGYVKKRLHFKLDKSVRTYLGYFFVVFGLVLYPLISYILEGSFDKVISFGLPCPTTITTFGFLMLASRGMPKHLLVIPVLWSLIGTAAATNFGVYQDYMMPLAAIVTLVYAFRKKH